MGGTWNNLTMRERAGFIKIGVDNGLTSLTDIKNAYNKFAEGGQEETTKNTPLSDQEYYTLMEKQAEINAPKWGVTADEAFLYMLNDNTYNYRGYYNKYPNSKANADTHWTDEFKTAFHPTFSKESIYSGKKSQYNPEGKVGGTWIGDKFIPNIEEKKYEAVKATPIRNDIEFVDTDRLQVDKYGNVLNPDTNHYGAVILPDVVGTGYGNGRAYYTNPNDRRLAELIRDENRRKEAYRQIYGTDEGFYMSPFAISDKPLKNVSPEADLILLGQGLGLRNLIKRGIGSAARREALTARGIPTSFKELSFSPEVSKDLLKEYKQIYKRNILNPELLQKVMDYTGLSMEEIIQMQSKNFYKALLNTNSKKVKYLLGDPESFGASKEFDISTALKIYNENAQNVLRTTQGQSAFLGNNYNNIFEVSDLPLDQTSLPLEDVPYFISYHGGDTGAQELGKFVLPKDPLYDNARRLLTDQGFYTSPNLEVAEGYTSFDNPAVYHVPIFGKPYFTDLGGLTEIRPLNWGMIENPRISSIPESVFTALKEKGYDYIYSPWQSEMVQNNPALLKVLKGSNGNFDITDPSSMFHALGGHIYDGETEDSQQIGTTNPPQGYIYKINDEYSIDDDTRGALFRGEYLNLLRNASIGGLKEDVKALRDLANRRKNPIIFDIDPDSRYGPVLSNMDEEERNRITQSYLNSALNMMRYGALLDPNQDGLEFNQMGIQDLKDTSLYDYQNAQLYAGLPQATYLMSPQDQYTLFMDQGWKYLGKGQYNLVKNAAKRHKKYGKEGLPTYQIKEDAYSRDDLMPIDNLNGYYVADGFLPEDAILPNPYNHPSTLYYNGNTGEFVIKGEDLNDYGGDFGSLKGLNILGNNLDKEGSPVVITTGFQPAINYFTGVLKTIGDEDDEEDDIGEDKVGKPITLEDIDRPWVYKYLGNALDVALAERGLHREKINDRWEFVSPDVVITPNGYAWGGNLYGDGGPWDIFKKGFNKTISIGSNLYHNIKDVLSGEKNKSNKDPLDKTTRQYGKLKSYARQMYENEDRKKHREPTDIEKKIFALSDSIDAATPAYYIPIHKDEMFNMNKTKDGKKEYAAAKMSTNMIDSIYKYYNPIVQDLDVILGQPDKEMTWGNPSVDESIKFLTGKDIPKEKQKQFINDGTWAFSPYNLLKYNNVVMRNYMYLREKYGADSPETQNWLKDNYKWLKHRANQIEFTGENVLTKAAKLYNRDYERESYNSGDPLYENRVIKKGKEMRTIPQVKEWETSL